MAIASVISSTIAVQLTTPLRFVRLTADQGLYANDHFTLKVTVAGLPSGVTLNKAWWTVKSLPTDADPGIFQKAITSSAVDGAGQITDTGSSGTATCQFDCVPADTTLLTALAQYVFDVQVRCSDNTLHTVVGDSSLVAGQGVTAATS